MINYNVVTIIPFPYYIFWHNVGEKKNDSIACTWQGNAVSTKIVYRSFVQWNAKIVSICWYRERAAINNKLALIPEGDMWYVAILQSEWSLYSRQASGMFPWPGWRQLVANLNVRKYLGSIFGGMRVSPWYSSLSLSGEELTKINLAGCWRPDFLQTVHLMYKSDVLHNVAHVVP